MNKMMFNIQLFASKKGVYKKELNSYLNSESY